MKKTKIQLIALALFSATSSIYAVDLFQSYQAALSYNADYLKQIANNQAAQELPNIARAVLLPQIGANAALTENYFDQQGMNAFYHQPTYAAQLTQVVVDFNKFSTLSKNKLSSQLANLQLTNAQQLLMVKVSQAYFDVLYAEDKLVATKRTKEAFEKQMKQADAAFKAGAVTIADVNDAKSGYDTAIAQEIQDTNNLIIKKNNFHNITGLDADQIQPLQDSIALNLPDPQSDSQWAEIAKQGNLNIKIATMQTNVAKENISIARSGHYPTLNFNAQYQYQDTSTLDSTNIPAAAIPNLSYPGGPLSTYGVGSALLSLSIPISAGGAINAQTRQAADNYSASVQQQVATERNTNQEVRNAYWQVANGVSIVNAQKTALTSAKTKLSSDELGYQVGLRNSVDLVNSQKNYYDIYQIYQQSKYQYLMAQVNLEYLSGKINSEFLQKINSNINQ